MNRGLSKPGRALKTTNQTHMLGSCVQSILDTILALLTAIRSVLDGFTTTPYCSLHSHTGSRSSLIVKKASDNLRYVACVNI